MGRGRGNGRAGCWVMERLYSGVVGPQRDMGHGPRAQVWVSGYSVPNTWDSGGPWVEFPSATECLLLKGMTNEPYTSTPLALGKKTQKEPSADSTTALIVTPLILQAASFPMAAKPHRFEGNRVSSTAIPDIAKPLPPREPSDRGRLRSTNAQGPSKCDETGLPIPPKYWAAQSGAAKSNCQLSGNGDGQDMSDSHHQESAKSLPPRALDSVQTVRERRPGVVQP